MAEQNVSKLRAEGKGKSTTEGIKIGRYRYGQPSPLDRLEDIGQRLELLRTMSGGLDLESHDAAGLYLTIGDIIEELAIAEHEIRSGERVVGYLAGS